MWGLFLDWRTLYSSFIYLQEIINRLAENRFHLPDTFGSYKLVKWDIEPPPKRYKSYLHSLHVHKILSSAVQTFSIIALLIKLFWIVKTNVPFLFKMQNKSPHCISDGKNMTRIFSSCLKHMFVSYILN